MPTMPTHEDKDEGTRRAREPLEVELAADPRFKPAPKAGTGRHRGRKAVGYVSPPGRDDEYDIGARRDIDCGI